MQMQTSASSSGDGGISSKPIIIILSAVILGLLSLVVGGGVAVYKVIQTHHMNSDTLQQLKSVESMVQQLKVRVWYSIDGKRSTPFSIFAWEVSMPMNFCFCCHVTPRALL